MVERPRIDLYCEDSGHEQFARALIKRLGGELGLRPNINTVSGRGGHGQCERHLYKQLLRQTIRSAGQPILTNEMEYAPDLVSAMDLFRAGKNQHSLRNFVDEIRRALQQLR